MPICSYLVLPLPGMGATIRERLAAMPGCEVIPAENRHLLIVVSDCADAEAADSTHDRISALPGIQALLLTFGEIAS